MTDEERRIRGVSGAALRLVLESGTLAREVALEREARQLTAYVVGLDPAPWRTPKELR